MAHAPKTADEVKLSASIRPVGWKKFIGNRYFYFSIDKGEIAARLAAWELMKRWDAKPKHVNTWEELDAYEKMLAADDEELWEDFAGMRAMSGLNAFGKPLPASQLPPRGPTLDELKTAYLTDRKKDVGLKMSNGITQHTYNCIAYRLARVLSFWQSDTRLSQITRETLKDCVRHWCALPEKQAKPETKDEAKEKPETNGNLSPETVKDYLNALRHFLKWIADNDKYNWTLPKRFDETFAVNPEPKEQSIRTLSNTELQTLFAKATNDKCHNKKTERGERRKLYLLLGMNCGFYQSEIASLLYEHIDFKAKTITRIREKTRKRNIMLVKITWKLWDETAALLEKHLASDNALGADGKRLALLNEDGKPLLNHATRNDAINLAFRRLCEAAKVKASFSNLRDTGAMAMQRLADASIADTYLAHTGKRGVLNHYASPDVAKLGKALKKWRDELKKYKVF